MCIDFCDLFWLIPSGGWYVLCTLMLSMWLLSSSSKLRLWVCLCYCCTGRFSYQLYESQLQLCLYTVISTMCVWHLFTFPYLEDSVWFWVHQAGWVCLAISVWSLSPVVCVYVCVCVCCVLSCQLCICDFVPTVCASRLHLCDYRNLVTIFLANSLWLCVWSSTMTVYILCVFPTMYVWLLFWVCIHMTAFLILDPCGGWTCSVICIWWLTLCVLLDLWFDSETIQVGDSLCTHQCLIIISSHCMYGQWCFVDLFVCNFVYEAERECVNAWNIVGTQ